ncbi:hypothetical protein AOZ07_01180 [Glutamicibacter halophytocola]|uniref:hypothetical protein n=1 Tax=Glutamicibacter halophytocola TaxID=1933880 RepID=UPI0006D4AA3B|nr:hypothetical protein [Glutamicibacter halophytocola]ALG27745.1 hypothetical protein AOZ07_01180 [Glutamicibacter halophytocola]
MKIPVGLLLVVLAMLMLSGCAGATPDGQPGPQDIFEKSRNSDRAPSAFHDDVQRESCGEITLAQGEQIPAEAIDCMDAATGERNAESAVLSPTTEGDPIITYYRTSADTSGIEMFSNGEYDKFGSRDWWHAMCPKSMTRLVREGCPK